MPGEARGEYIHLVWEGTADALFVRGHMEPMEAVIVLEDYHDGMYQYKTPVRAWARWSVGPSPDGCSQCFVDYDAPGRGRFEVMRAEVVAKHLDPYSWQTRRHGIRRDWHTRELVPNTPAELACDCPDWNGHKCPCLASCGCHWSPRLGDPWREGTVPVPLMVGL